MMKSLKHILLCVLALAALTSCIGFQEVSPIVVAGAGDELVFSPQVMGLTPATKSTPGVADRGENSVKRIDVFVYKTTGGTSVFHKHYTIPENSTDNYSSDINIGVDYVLESNWRANYTTTDTYRVYAIANIHANQLRNPVLPESPTEEQLHSLTSISKASIKGQYNYECFDIVRLKNPDGTSPADGSLDHHIGDKLFLMDGRIDNWQIDGDNAKQYFTKKTDLSFDLSRAAAKFRVELDFSEQFKASLGNDDGTGLKFTAVTEYWPLPDDAEEGTLPQPKTVRIITIGTIDKNAEDKVYADGVVSGGARAKFANILKATYNVAPDATYPTAAAQAAFRDTSLWDSQSFYEFSYRTPRTLPDGGTGYKYPYIDTTYSYAFSWEEGRAAEKAPALGVSIIYTTYIQKYNQDGTFDGEATSDGGVINYYRIPLIDITKSGAQAVNEIKRNYYYQVFAEINTMGTSSTDIEPTGVNLNYKVIPWPDAPDEKTEAQTVQLLYFVPEKEFRLRGDGLQSTYLQYFTPKSDPVSTSGSTTYYQATPKIKNVKVYYYDQNGDTRTLQTDAAGVYSWTSNDAAGVTIQVLPQANGGGRFYVTSTALANRSVKYIEFDAEVDFSYTGGQTMSQHIIVTHFPLDNIQSIPGAWSSRWNGQSGGGTTTRYYRKLFYKQDIVPVSVTEAVWAAGIGNNNDNRRNANSVSTAVNGYYATGGSQSTVQYRPQGIAVSANVTRITGYSWNGTSVTFNGTNENPWYWPYGSTWNHEISGYDYVVSHNVSNGYAVITLWKYTNYYHLENQRVTSYSPTGPEGTWTSYDGFEWEECTHEQYNNSAPENRKIETFPTPPSTGNWVDWDTHTGTIYSETTNPFRAKYWGPYYPNIPATGGGNSYVYNMTGNNSGEAANSSDSRLRNNHMYVIQISKAEAGVILGRPTLDNNYQSNDNVVSPAFMIASQLGAVSTYSSATSAAAHCHTYMEVAHNGRRFVGWRLPTEAEIQYILNYQTNTAITQSGVFEAVLTGESYYTLKGTLKTTEYTGEGTNRVRCIRDLTPEEVIELNNTGAITAASY